MRWYPVAVLLFGLLGLALLGTLLGEVGPLLLPGLAMAGIDANVTGYLTERRTGALTQVMLLVTALGDLWLVTLVVLGLGVVLRLRQRPWQGLWLPAIAGAGALIVSVVVKVSTNRLRPPEPYAIVEAAGAAFPSGHALRAMAVYGALAWAASAVVRSHRQRAAIWASAALIVVGVGFSRVYLGAHWLTDVLAGYALGAAWLALLIAVAHARPSAPSSEPVLEPPAERPAVMS